VIFLVMAPMLPLAGIAVAYGPGVDPTYEIGLAAPLRSFHLLMVRATAVLATSGAMALIASLVLAPPAWALAAWLLPALGLAVISLALATVISPMRSAVSVSVMWVFGCGAGITSAARTSATLQDFFGGLQMIVAAIALLGAALLYARRDLFEGGGRR
jgi:hypothetical protein